MSPTIPANPITVNAFDAAAVGAAGWAVRACVGTRTSLKQGFR
jgi:hypothetical protein